MSQTHDDPRVTAYVFGELPSDQVAEFERELQSSTDLQQEVASVREAVKALEMEFAENVPTLSEQQVSAVENAIQQTQRPSAPSDQAVAPATMQANRSWRKRVAVLATLAASLLLVATLSSSYWTSIMMSEVSMSVETADRAMEDSVELAPESMRSQVPASMSGAGQLEESSIASNAAPMPQADASSALAIDASSATEAEEAPSRGRSMQRSAVANARANAPANAPAEKSVGDQGVTPRPTIGRQTHPTEAPTSTAGIAPAPSPPSAAAPAADAPAPVDSFRRSDALAAPPSSPSRAKRQRQRSAQMMSDMGADMSMDGMGMMGGMDEMMDSADMDMGGMGGMSMEMGMGGYRAPSGTAASPGANDYGMSMGPQAPRSSSVRGQVGRGYGDGINAMGGGGAGGAIAGGARREAESLEDFSMDMELGDADPFGVDAEMAEEEVAEEQVMEDFDMMDSMMLVEPNPIRDNPFVETRRAPLSTFSVDVDTASYTKMRGLMRNNALPSPQMVRIEEMVNYFDYDYPGPDGEHPFEASMLVAQCPWNREHRLARIGIQAKRPETQRPASNLVFLLDVSGSMDQPQKLPLMIEGMKMLTDQLTENDSVAIVVYAGAAGLVLDATNGDKKQEIVTSLDRLRAGGSTNGGEGIQLAYELARQHFIVGGTNRVILCTDGDFNVGVTGTDQVVELAKQNAKTNVFLTILGFGIGSNDSMMEQVSNNANGNYAFIDSKGEAAKVLVEELGGTLDTVAKDVKIQIEFNPQEVSSYRLIGYENRLLNDEDFANDAKDAGDIGAGHTVTALYELVLNDRTKQKPIAAAGLRYQTPAGLTEQADSGELLVLRLRYKQPDGDVSQLMETPVTDFGKSFAQTDRDFQFAAAVAGFGMILRNSPHRGDWTLRDVLSVATENAKGDDYGYRTEFVELVQKAAELLSQ